LTSSSIRTTVEHNNNEGNNMTIKEQLEQAYEMGESVTINTEWSEYEDALVTSLGDTMVGFTAIHPLKGGEYDFEFYIAGIRKVQFN
jgi:hypothetical protein